VAGEPTAAAATRVETWIEAYEPEIRRHLLRMTGDGDDTADLLQHVWLAAVRNPLPGGPDTNTRAWLYRVATHAALDLMSGRRRRRSALVRRGPAEDEPEPADAGLSGLDDRGRRRVREAVARLPEKQREAVWLRWAEELEYPEIARRLDSSRQSARANVYQGMKKLRSELADLWSEGSLR